MAADLERFLALVLRELGAQDARVVGAYEPGEPPDGLVLASRIAGESWIVARFDEPPADRDAKQRRLDMLASTFDVVVEEAPTSRRSRPPVALSLKDELEALCARALAVNVVVIDANSPVVWGEARAEAGGEVASRHALQAVRDLAEGAGLRKGKHVRQIQGSGSAPFVARSFAGIYLLVVVFDAPFDELRAERAVLEALPRIERLVLALPPQDPPPDATAGVIAMRRPRRR